MKILALDLGKSKSVGCVYQMDDRSHEFVTVRTTPRAIHDLLVNAEPDRLVMEVGTPAGWIYDIAVALGIAVQVANPNHEGWRWRNVKRKTDRLDALKLAQLSAMDQLPQVHMPDTRTREHRALIHYRGKLVSRRTRIKNTIRSLLHRQGLPMAAGAKGWMQASLAERKALARPWDQVLPEQLWRGELLEELTALEQIESRLSRVEKHLDQLAARDERITRLQTIPCVGPRTAELLVTVIDNPPLRAVYQRVCGSTRTRRKIAIVAVARKLLTWAWAMLRDGTEWNPPRERQAAYTIGNSA